MNSNPHLSPAGYSGVEHSLPLLLKLCRCDENNSKFVKSEGDTPTEHVTCSLLVRELALEKEALCFNPRKVSAIYPKPF